MNVIVTFQKSVTPRPPQNVNPIYNLLPDILSALGAEAALPEASFQAIMAVLLGYIDRKHVEPLADKLTQRLGNVAEARPRRLFPWPRKC